jgi:hypothetical protein
VRHRDNPWSAWVFATAMTGKADRNMGEVKSDHLVYQFFLAGLKVLIGAERTTTYVFNQLDLSFQKGDTGTYATSFLLILSYSFVLTLSSFLFFTPHYIQIEY